MLDIWHKDFKISDDLIKDLGAINENRNELYFKDLKNEHSGTSIYWETCKNSLPL
jgi:hypothetical protein